MDILKKIRDKQNDNKNSGITVCFFGDSVTQGCFEVFRPEPDRLQSIFDKSSAYHKYFADIFTVLCPSVPVNVINAGVSGARASLSLGLIDDLVLKNNPDLVVVCFGLNDANDGLEKINVYKEALTEIFRKIKAIGAEIIFMTPNMLCNSVSPHIKDDLIKSVAESSALCQQSGVFDKYMDAAREVCIKESVIICDCYKKWKRMAECGINITELLANKINHPTRQMNWLFAYSLVETIFNTD